jgi:hypothetical protein
VPLEDLHQAREVQQRAAESINFVNQNRVDSTGLDVDQQLAQRRSFQVRSRISSIVIALGQDRPARVSLAPNVSLGRFSLCFEGIELLAQTFFCGFADIHRAPQRTRLRRFLRAEPPPLMPHDAAPREG